MFSSNSRHGRQQYGRPKKEANTKKHHIRDWMRRNKKKAQTPHRVMMSGDPPPPLHTSVSTIGYDIPDDARHGKISPTTPLASKPTSPEGDAEAIEEEVPIVKKTLPIPEPQPKIERNGFDVGVTKKSINDPEEESCVVNCIYFTQQCCECTIL